MNKALVTMAKAFSQLLDAYYNSFDRETADLMRSLAAWVEKNQ
jgi:hypothetical protein